MQSLLCNTRGIQLANPWPARKEECRQNVQKMSKKCPEELSGGAEHPKHLSGQFGEN